MQTGYVIFILGIVLILVLFIVLLAWIFFRKSSTSASTNSKTQHVVQKLFSQDLHKRALIIEYGQDRYQVVRSHYSDRIINNITGEVVGWQNLEDKPVVTSLYDAVQIAEKWLHQEN